MSFFASSKSCEVFHKSFSRYSLGSFAYETLVVKESKWLLMFNTGTCRVILVKAIAFILSKIQLFYLLLILIAIRLIDILFENYLRKYHESMYVCHFHNDDLFLQ